jgi:hypothetical protein
MEFIKLFILLLLPLINISCLRTNIIGKENADFTIEIPKSYVFLNESHPNLEFIEKTLSTVGEPSRSYFVDKEDGDSCILLLRMEIPEKYKDFTVIDWIDPIWYNASDWSDPNQRVNWNLIYEDEIPKLKKNIDGKAFYFNQIPSVFESYWFYSVSIIEKNKLYCFVVLNSVFDGEKPIKILDSIKVNNKTR